MALEFTPDKLSRLKVPAGFQLKVMATGLGNARSLLVMPDGGIYLSRMKQGDVWYLKDVNGDGQIENVERKRVAQNMSSAHGMSVRGGKLYVAAEKTIWVMDMAKDGSLSVPRVFADGFPDAGQHGARGMHWGPDGYLYAAFGSTNNDSRTPNPEEATMLRISPDGKSREIYSSGLRHTIGFGWHPVTGVLYGFDQGSDWHGDNIPPEEMNVIERGKNYGWPFCYGDKNPDPYVNLSSMPGKVTKAEYCAQTQGSLLNYTAHAAAIDAAFYTGNQFPADYKNSMFVAYRGSWNRSEPSGYQIAHVNFDAEQPAHHHHPFRLWLRVPGRRHLEAVRAGGGRGPVHRRLTALYRRPERRPLPRALHRRPEHERHSDEARRPDRPAGARSRLGGRSRDDHVDAAPRAAERHRRAA